MPAIVCVIDRIVITVTVQIQAIDGFSIQVGCVVRRNESAPFGAVISSVAIVQAGIIVVVVAAVTNGVCASQRIVGGFAGNGAVTPGIIQVLGLQNAVGVVNCHHITLEIPLEIIAGSGGADGVLHADDRALVIEVHDAFAFRAGAVIGLGAAFRDQPAGMIVVEVFVVSSDLARLDRVIAGGARQVGIGLGDPLAQRIVAIVIVAGAGGQSALKQPGHPALAPGSGLALVGSGAAHGVVGDGRAATYILPSPPPGVKKKADPQLQASQSLHS